MTAKHTEASITELLRQKYAAPEWAFFAGVPDATGFQKRRTADGIAMSLWPSRGLHLYGFEIKVSRSDWQKELQDPTKADAFARYCHCWQIVAPKGVVKVEELPPSWGLLEVTDKGNLRSKKAVEIAEPREQPGLAFVAALLRSASKDLESQFARVWHQAATEARDKTLATAKAKTEAIERAVTRRERDLEEACNVLKSELGIEVRGWQFTATEHVRAICRTAAELQGLVGHSRNGEPIHNLLKRLQEQSERTSREASRVVDALAAVANSEAETEAN